MLNVSEMLEEIKNSPYREIEICAPHTGRVNFGSMQQGSKVEGPHGLWKEKSGTLLCTLDRERNPKPITAIEKGELCLLHSELEGCFVEAGTRLAVIRHLLTRDEVQAAILKKALHLFTAPERAKYYFVPEIDKKIRTSGSQSVTVKDGMEVFIMSRMKREVPLVYTGPEGVIYAVYFKHTDNVDAEQPLIGVCLPAQLAAIQEVIMRVQTEWTERG
jgi:hypothetical protein